MRQSNQKSRSRGRGRKPQNPMSRNFESNGPDVKIRGNASHIADKYASLARDALSNGDTVIAENYLQHAEHYNRIVASAQQQSDARAAEMAEKRRVEQENDNSDGQDNPENTSEATEAKASDEDNATASSSESSDKVDEQPSKERKNGRTRRPRKQPVAEAENGKNEDASKDSSDDVVITAEVISEDAAKLPEGLLGGMAAEDS